MDNMTSLCGIYAIVNTVTGRAYIGLTRNSFAVRWAKHRYHLAVGTHHNEALQTDWDTYGADAFAFRILEVIDQSEPSRVFFQREQYFISLGIQPVYNSHSNHKTTLRPRPSHPRRAPSCVDLDDNVVARLVDQLFKTHRHPSGREYTYAEVSRASGAAVEPVPLGRLRNGVTKNPGRDFILFLCLFFHVPASYFFPELESIAKHSTRPRNIDAEMEQALADLSIESKEALLVLLDTLTKEQQE